MRSSTAVRSTAGRALLHHLLASLGVIAAVLALVALGEWRTAEATAEATASRSATTIAAAVGEALESADFGDRQRPADRASIDRALAPAFATGSIVRAKIWRVEGTQVTVVHSDEPRLIGEVRPFDPGLARRLDSGEAVVLPVPDDNEHRFEANHPADLREVFLGFTDRAGTPMRFELYVKVDVSGDVLRSLRGQLPILAIGLLLITAGMIPLSVRTARRLDRLAAERAGAVHYAVTAAEEIRRDVAQRLHDDVIQDLAATGLALGTIASDPQMTSENAQVLRRLAGVLGKDTEELRALALAAAPSSDRSLADHLTAVLSLHPRPPALRVDEPDDPLPAPVAELMWRVAAELVRNSAQHAGASQILVELRRHEGRVRLTVGDDGGGMDDTRERDDHLGLALIDHAVSQQGGTMTIRSAPGTGTTVEVTMTLERDQSWNLS
jgi:signal transduction histidine kinase